MKQPRRRKQKRVTESNDEAENLIQTNSSILGSRDNQALSDVASESHSPNISVTQERKAGRGSSKNGNLAAKWNLLRRGQETMVTMKLMLTGVCMF